MFKFLIIDDEKSNRFLLNSLLRKNFDCEIFEAENGEIGLKVLIDNKPDLILLDISMPVMDGLNTLKIIRSNQTFMDIPVIVITALSSGKVVGEFAEKGISDFILKPIDTLESVERIKKVLNKQISPAEDSELKPDLLIVDKDTQFRTFINLIFGNKFQTHAALSGIDGLELFSKFRPRLVFISDTLSLLDKKILTQKIKDTDSDNEVSIYLLADDLTKLSTKVFHYDGIIKKSLDKELFFKSNSFLKDLITEVPSVRK